MRNDNGEKGASGRNEWSERHPSALELQSYGVYPARLEHALATATVGSDRALNVVAALLERGSTVDGLTRALLLRDGTAKFAGALAETLDLSAQRVARVVDSYLDETGGGDFALTGAEAVALTLHDARVRRVFAYPGTSELALCDQVARVPGVTLINGRGDKESVFMAGGASMTLPCAAAAIVHGARGSTNALGAIADLRRSEIGTVVIVGMASTTSARFLPPHAELALLSAIGTFAKSCHETAVTVDNEVIDRHDAAREIKALRSAITLARTPPCGPTIIAMAQDQAQRAWVPRDVVTETEARHAPVLDLRAITTLADTLMTKRSPLIFIDDFFLRYPGARPRLREVSDLLGAPVLQVRYRRGPMLFERLARSDVPRFYGWYDPEAAAHRRLLAEADFLVTLEDRNLYPRVVGAFPTCGKAALTSAPELTRKNGYLADGDLLIAGDVGESLSALAYELRRRGGARPRPAARLSNRALPRSTTTSATRSVATAIRRGVTVAFATAFSSADTPVLVDDSQLFGGLLCSEYDQFPPRLRVFGSHGGFVGWGIAAAAGLAVGEPQATVVCTLGDHGLMNGVQGLVAVRESDVPVTYVVCNNGGTVSLCTQTQFDDRWSFNEGDHPFLRNVSGLDYARIADAFGLAFAVVDFASVDTVAEVEPRTAQLEAELLRATGSRRPYLVELKLPSSGPLWDGLWSPTGNEFAGATSVSRLGAGVGAE